MTLKRFLALLLAAALLGGLPVLAFANEAPLPESEFALGEVSEYGDIAIIDDAVGTAPAPSLRRGAMRTTGAPTSYDPRESGGFLPPVRSQGGWNTCWAVAAVGAAETDGLLRGLLPTSAAETNLSERHLIYFFSHQTDDPLGNSSRDYNTNPSYWINSGGNPVIASMALAGWHGPADETATNSPYSGLTTNDSLDAAYAYTDELHLENTYAVDISSDSGRSALKSMILEHGGALLCLYFDSEYLFAGSPSAQAEEPGPDPEETPAADGSGEPADEPGADETPDEGGTADDGEPETLPEEPEETPPEEPSDPEPPAETEPPEETEDTDAPEEDVPEPEPPAEEPAPDGGTAGLDGAPEAEEPLPADGEEAEADDFTVCYYMDTPASPATNHEVLIVGWDDSYPAENFGYSPEGAAPAQNGAWLCRNSHGGSWYGGDGYFWVSYYDASVSARTGGSISGRATVFEFGPADNYDNNYEYDGGAVLAYVNDTIDGTRISTDNADSGTERWYANVFTACGNSQTRGSEYLRAVSTYTYRAGTSYTAQVYTSLTDPSDPASGTLAAEVSGAFPYAGYHTVELPEKVHIDEGEIFSVIFCVGPAADNSLYVPSCHTSSQWYCTNETLAGQSFVSIDGGVWKDCLDLRNEPNVRIKAFTDNTPIPFSDVSRSAWYYDNVLWGWRSYYINGTSATTYGPELTATRAQVVTLLWRLAGEPAPAGAPDFSDVEAGAWYADAVAWAQENGVVNGYGDGRFCPHLVVSRQEFMTILFRYAGKCGMDTSARESLIRFRDYAAVAGWAGDAVNWSIASGLQQGVQSSTGSVYLDPEGSVTRAQLAAFLNRFADMLP